MAPEIQHSTDQSVTSLVSGIIDDLRDLVKQQLRLTRHEIVADLHKARESALMFILGAGILFLGAIVLCFALVHLLHWAVSPTGTDPARLPLWACYGLVGLALTVVGGVLGWAGEMKLRTIRPLDSTASEALKDNVEWATRSKAISSPPNGVKTDYNS